ncbi:hypothetical protein ISF_04187 [Cordyceps fumosorosea ARSEF 2679]|uniref:AA1-like domain-containing protein n=1 Tax=Cordyceps fumosorosea (strain ARSEF 2679) TaxID=1081104 RepID=A0A167XBT4_CORFA|nr:hypothetical protein ISF_04187 [Cordyceps fumosorosea ARSEF 2679]OAA64777.1 hypothetical protein ISF_04187 [Cordyceps fumosorosea ARSEF 2679]
MYGLTTVATTALLAASALAAPAATIDGTESCTRTSTRVTTFNVKDFDFHASWTFSTPAHQIAGGYVNFTLGNAALPYVYTCSAASTQLEDFYYGNFIYNCTDPTGRQTREGTFTYSRPTTTLAINQTWECPEGSRFWAEGAAKLDLHCNETKWQNPNWQPGQIYSSRSVTCDKLTQPVPITNMRAAA